MSRSLLSAALLAAVLAGLAGSVLLETRQFQRLAAREGLARAQAETLSRLAAELDGALLETVLGAAMPQLDRVLNALAAVADPECIVFGGQIPRALAETFIARAQFFARPRHGHLNPLPELVVSGLGGDTPAIGAACLPLRALAF
ncbi:ROK family protein [Mangrovicoccus ximenensis]|uniref:ROK family protein n=1 Tax=Mangrovicoccus ximenensis TaxID=1911570 RepID=UPI0011AE3955|nr:ROK family protein [Mangrovicoccus ximenensis]